MLHLVVLREERPIGSAEDTWCVHRHHPEHEEQQRNDGEYICGHNHAHPGLQLGDALARLPPRQHAGERRADAREHVRHAGQVADDVVAVQPDERQELVQDLEVHERDHEQQGLVARQRVDAGRRQHEDDVEVDAAEVRA